MIIEPGVYGDDSFGLVHVNQRVFETAFSLGWNPSPKDMEIIESYPRDWEKYSPEENCNYNMIIDDIIDEILDFLNENHRDEYHYWGFEDGNFGYFPFDPEEEEGVY
jgi:hypothetical protein